MVRRKLAVALAGLAALGVASTAHGATAGPSCHATDLAGALIDVQGAAGSQFGRVILINTSPRTCHLRGFPGGRFVASGGRRIPTHVTRDHATAVRRVVILPGSAAAFGLRWSDVPSGSQRCKTARWLRVTPPNATSTLRVHFGHAPCGGRLSVRAVTTP